MPLSRNGFTPLDCQCFKTIKSFKHRNAFYKNEADIRLKSHHTMQRKPEDRVLPYIDQNILDTSKTNHLKCKLCHLILNQTPTVN